MTRPVPTNPNPVDFGPNVLIFDTSMPMADITAKMSPVFWSQNQDASEFGSGRYAYLFKPSPTPYDLNVDVGYYMTVHGLGSSPGDVTITGAVQSLSTRTQGLALNNFWRGMENLTIIPTNPSISGWAVSQATFMRRVHVKGQLFLWDYRYDNQGGNFSSGGFIADSVIDNQVISGTQQQFLTRNTTLTNWIGGVWNMVFVGDEQAPISSWPNDSFTVVPQTPIIREKPYLTIDSSGNYAVQVPKLKTASTGTSWSRTPDPTPLSISISQFYIAKADTDTADSLNNALQEGYNLIITPGVYHLSKAINVIYADTVILGLGMATLIPSNGTSAMIIPDVSGVSISGLIFDCGSSQTSPPLLVGSNGSITDHTNPTALYDLCSRVGGATVGSTQSCFVINSNNVLLDNLWIWRADHGNPGTVGWNINPAETGIIINGNNVTAYGLFVEHFQGFQTIWNGNNGACYFYQSEIPYDVPEQKSWTQPGGERGWSSYKVADGVTQHTAMGLGVYCNFYNKVWLENAISTPSGHSGIKMNHMVIDWLDGVPGSGINHIINGTGGPVPNLTARSQT